MDRLVSILKRATAELEEKIRFQHYAGYDPYDVKGAGFFMLALAIPRHPWYSNLRRKLTLAPLIYGEQFFPRVFRRLFGVKPQVNAKGMGLIAKSYFHLLAATGDKQWLERGEAILNWLLENRAANQPYPCWGYPFNWDSGVTVPAFTPASVVSVAAFDAFWEAWLQTKKKSYLETCVGICDFFLCGLNRTEYPDDTLCFSYTSLDNFEVNNINLMIAHCLLRVGKETGKDLYSDYGIRAVRFTLNEQNNDGSIFYWSKAQNHDHPNRIDHYHSGFEIRALFGIWQVTGDPVILNAFRNYYEFYRRSLFERKGDAVIPKMEIDGIYPINIHACAEAILLSATLCGNDHRALEDLQQVVPWTLKRMRMKDGWYRYMIRKLGPFELTSNMVYMRWGQAWMFLALTQALRSLGKVKSYDK